MMKNAFSTAIPFLISSKLVEKNIKLAFFSGTGNTLLTVERLKQRLEAKDFDKKVELFPIERTKPEDFLGDPHKIPENVYGIAAPITMTGTYPIVLDFYNKLDINQFIDGKNRPKLISIATMGYFHGGYFGPMKRRMQKLGFAPFAAESFTFQFNLKLYHPENKEKHLIEQAMLKADRFAESMISGTAKWREAKPAFLSELAFKFSKNKRLWKNVAEGTKIDDSLCTGCQICVHNCPTKALKAAKLPNPTKSAKGKPKVYRIEKNNDLCIACARCKGFCPENCIWGEGKNRQYAACDLKHMQNSLKLK